MFHVRPNSHFVAFTVVFLAVMHSCRGRHLVIGPPEPVVALVGEDVILPCHLNPAMNAFEMTVEWARPDLNPRFVFVWRDGVELKSKNHHLYEGRTSLFTDELKNGNISMILSKVRLSDEGEYKCFVPDVGESKVLLVVGAVSSPVVNMTKNSSTAVLQCESKGWYPEPEVFWLDAEGNLLSAGPTETVRGPDDLYTVSRRLTVEKSDSFTCRVQQKNIKQTRETHIYVPDGFFVVPSTSSQHVVIGSVIGCAALMVVLAAVFVLWKRKQRKSKNKMMSPEDGAEQTEKHKTITSKSENTEVQIEMEEEGESVPLMAAREEKNNEDYRGEQIKSQSEHNDAEFVMERETQQDQDQDVRETEPPSVSREVTERPNLKIHQETAERKHKEVQAENELQAEKQEETREQPERSIEVVNVEFKERRSDKGADDDETQKTSKETEKQEELQPAKEVIREQTQNLQSVNEQNRERERTEQVHVVQQQAARRKRDQRKNREPRKEIKKNYLNKPQIQDLNSQEEEEDPDL